MEPICSPRLKRTVVLIGSFAGSKALTLHREQGLHAATSQAVVKIGSLVMSRLRVEGKLYRDYIGVYVGITEKKMETTIV